MRTTFLFFMSLVILLTTFSRLWASEAWLFDPEAESTHLILAVGEVTQVGGENTALESYGAEELGKTRPDLVGASELGVFRGFSPGHLELAKSEEPEESIRDDFDLEDEEAEEPLETISDPLEPINRVFFHFNDKLYFWLLKPAAQGYNAIAPESFRVAMRNFFYNLGFPIYFVNCLLQGKFKRAGDEVTRFMVNTFVGVFGFYDVAGTNLDIKSQEEDFGQTLGFYGLGPAFYINWPFLGPSSLRDSVGWVADLYTQPLNYVVEFKYNVAVRAYNIVNNTSLTIGDYESLKKAAIDPYVAVRDAYYQYRRDRIKD